MCHIIYLYLLIHLLLYNIIKITGSSVELSTSSSFNNDKIIIKKVSNKIYT